MGELVSFEELLRSRTLAALGGSVAHGSHHSTRDEIVLAPNERNERNERKTGQDVKIMRQRGQTGGIAVETSEHFCPPLALPVFVC